MDRFKQTYEGRFLKAVSKEVKKQFPTSEQYWAVEHLLKLRILPVFLGAKKGTRKMSQELARAKLAVLLNQPFRRPEQLRSGIINITELTDREADIKMEGHLVHDKFLDSSFPKVSRAYANELAKSDRKGRHSILCSELEWEVLTRWKAEVSVFHKKRELKIFVDRLKNKTSYSNFVKTIHQLGLSKRLQNR